jgi:hypothetical protein
MYWMSLLRSENGNDRFVDSPAVSFAKQWPIRACRHGCGFRKLIDSQLKTIPQGENFEWLLRCHRTCQEGVGHLAVSCGNPLFFALIRTLRINELA